MSSKKKKLMVVVGAGASMELGMPGVYAIDKLFCDWSKEHYKLAEDENQSLYSYIRCKINHRYYSLNPKAGYTKKTNFEEVLYVILQLSAALSDDRDNGYNFPMNAFHDLKEFPKIISFEREKLVDGNDLRQLCFFLIDKLIDEFRERCKTAKASNLENFEHFKNFITQLNNDYDVAFISLNYDNLITQVCPGLFTGFNENSGLFDAVSVYERDRWGLIYHLHGSVHFDMQGDKSDMHAIKWNSDLNSKFEANSLSRSAQRTTEGIMMPTSVIVTGYGKTNQIQKLPFRTYYSRLDEIALTAYAFLFLGYGFNDLHLNNCFHSIRKGKRAKPVVVVDWAEDTQNPLEFRSDRWPNNLCQTLQVNARDMVNKGYQQAVAVIADLKSNDEFEISNNPKTPLAIWYGGFIKACQNYKKIKEEIDSADSTIFNTHGISSD
jgi:hypothetical protein